MARVTTSATFDPVLTVSNIKSNGTADPNVVFSNASWAHAQGKIVLDFKNQSGEHSVFQAGALYTMDVVLENPARHQESPQIFARVWSGVEQQMTRATGDSSPLKVTQATITLSSVSQTSDVPCDDSTISITASFNVPLPLSCAPTLTIQGLKGSRISPVYVNNSRGNVFTHTVGQGLTWDTSQGKLGFAALSDVPAGAHVFNVTLRNPDRGQMERRVRVYGNISNAANTAVQFQDTLNPLLRTYDETGAGNDGKQG